MNRNPAKLDLANVVERPDPGISPTFPVWVVKGRRHGWLKIQCPRHDCREVTFVAEINWMKAWPSGVKTRPCPYCFKAARHEGPQLEEREVPSSDGSKTYIVTLLDGKPTACSCAGFTYRSACRHMAQA
jgi:hypothetical protein